MKAFDPDEDATVALRVNGGNKAKAIDWLERDLARQRALDDQPMNDKARRKLAASMAKIEKVIDHLTRKKT